MKNICWNEWNKNEKCFWNKNEKNIFARMKNFFYKNEKYFCKNEYFLKQEWKIILKQEWNIEIQAELCFRFEPGLWVSCLTTENKCSAADGNVVLGSCTCTCTITPIRLRGSSNPCFNSLSAMGTEQKNERGDDLEPSALIRIEIGVIWSKCKICK